MCAYLFTRVRIDTVDIYTMSIGEGFVGTTSSATTIVVMGPPSLLASVCEGPSVVGAIVVDEDRR